MFDFFWVPLTTFVIAAAAILTLRPIARVCGLVDRPDSRKRHTGEVPLVGGIAITTAVLLGALLFMRAHGYYVALFGGLVVLTLVGIKDDLNGMAPITKLLAQLFVAILMTSWGGVYLSSLGDLLGRREVELANWGIPLTMFAAVAVINAMNMSDGLDGLCGGLALTIFAWFAYISGEIGNTAAQRICVIFCGALFGFLMFNLRNPLRGRKRVFLGDAGSLMLGFGIVWFSVELSQPRYNLGNHVPPVVMLWLLGFVLIDLLSVTVRRAMKGRNPLAADRTHVHHVLLRLGVGPDAIVWVLLATNALTGFVGVLGWKYGFSDQTLFLLFLVVTVIHLCAMRNAWRFVRYGRRFFKKE